MTSETAFATQYTSMWRGLAPSMEEFVRRQNMDGYTRTFPPLPGAGAAERRGIINEAAFIVFSKIAGHPRADVGNLILSTIDEAFASAYAYVTAKVDDDAEVITVSIADKREATALALRLHAFFGERADGRELIVSPRFRGSGLIGSCAGDVLIEESILYEVKSGDRPFRSVDYRQVAVYNALRFAEVGRPFERLGVINPRRGIFVEVAAEEFAREVAGQSAVSFCQSLIEAFSVRLASL